MSDIMPSNAANRRQRDLFSNRGILVRSAATKLLTRAAGVFALALCILAVTGTARAAKPELDPSYADGKTYYMIGPHMITDPSPALFEQSEELYIVAYPWDGTTPPVFASGYVPQCNPCYHPGLPIPFVYHDHVLSGATGLGNHGTAGEFKSPWKIIVMMYSPAALADPDFKPVTSELDLDAAEAAGVFLPINPGAENPYEVITGSVLICPLVSPAA
ncbi:MAG TPA: hypothetical protein VGH81_03595 [Rudaea sp.]|jgi:hypothetical protein